MKFTHSAIVLALGLILIAPCANAQKGKPNNNSAQERKDDARIKDAKGDVSEAQDRIEKDLKEAREVETELKKSVGLVATTRKAMEDVKDQLEETLGQKLGLPKAVQEQQIAQRDYDDAAKPVLAALSAKPEYAAAAERAASAQKLLDSLTPGSDFDAAKKQQSADAAAIVASFRSQQKSAVDSAPEMATPRGKLKAAQEKLTSLRSQLRKQVESHRELQAAEQKWVKAKAEHSQVEQRLSQLRKKIAADQNKLAAEKSQLQQAIVQDKRNDDNNKNKNKNNNNKNKKG